MDKYIIYSESSSQLIESYDELVDRVIFLEAKIKEMHENGLISDIELSVIEMVEEEKSFSQISRELNLARSTTTKIFRNACNRIAFYLGGYYTDDGFIDRLKENFNLSREDIYKVYEKINGKYRHQV